MYAIQGSDQTQTYILDESKKVSAADGDFYRLALPFHFETGALADEVAIQTATISGQFAAHEYSLASSALADRQDAVLVTLPSPRRVQRIRVKSTALDNASQKLALHRVDVEAIAEKPTMQVGNNAPLAQEFSDLHFAIYREGRKHLGRSQVEEIRVCSDPAGPRLGIAVGDLENIVYFWQGTAEIENADLAGTLDRFLNRHLAALAEQGQAKPDQIDVTLLFESSTPCEVQLDELGVDYHLVVNSWTANLSGRDSEKEVLRFRSDLADSQALAIVLPDNATVHQAKLKVVESQAGSPLKPGPNGGGPAPPLTNPSPAEKSGGQVGTEHWIAQTIQLDGALTAASLTLALMPLAEGTEVNVALQESWQDQPSGSNLAEGKLRLGAPGRAVWATLALPEAVTLSTQPYWLMLKAAQGQAVWLAQSGPATTKIWQQPPGKGTWSQVRDLSGYRLLYQFLAPRRRPPEGAAEAEGTSAESTCRLTVGGQAVSPGKRAGDTVEYDLTAALNAHLTALKAAAKGIAISGEGEKESEIEAEKMSEPGTSIVVAMLEAGADATIPLEFSALGLKQITVFPPEIEYSYQAG